MMNLQKGVLFSVDWKLGVPGIASKRERERERERDREREREGERERAPYGALAKSRKNGFQLQLFC